MNFSQKIIAKNVILKCINSHEWKHQNEDLISHIGSFETLDAFFEYLVLSKDVPLNCLPHSYIQNKDFLLKLLAKKQALINEIYQVNFYIYRDILPELELNKFLKRCKFALLPQIKRDINFLLDNQTKQDEITAIIPTSKNNSQVPTKK